MDAEGAFEGTIRGGVSSLGELVMEGESVSDGVASGDKGDGREEDSDEVLQVEIVEACEEQRSRESW